MKISLWIIKDAILKQLPMIVVKTPPPRLTWSARASSAGRRWCRNAEPFRPSAAPAGAAASTWARWRPCRGSPPGSSPCSPPGFGHLPVGEGASGGKVREGGGERLPNGHAQESKRTREGVWLRIRQMGWSKLLYPAAWTRRTKQVTHLQAGLVGGWLLIHSSDEDAEAVLHAAADHEAQGLRAHHLHLHLSEEVTSGVCELVRQRRASCSFSTLISNYILIYLFPFPDTFWVLFRWSYQRISRNKDKPINARVQCPAGLRNFN